VRQALEAQFYGRAGVQQALPGVRDAVAAGQLTPWAAAGRVLGYNAVPLALLRKELISSA